MESRITVSDFHRTTNLIDIIPIKLQKGFFTDHHFYAIEAQSPTQLKKYSLKSRQLIESIGLPNGNSIKDIVEYKQKLCVSFENEQKLWVMNQGFIFSHLSKINCLLTYQQLIVSCSDDLTVRLWSLKGECIIQDSTQHILSGHTNVVNCLQKINGYLVSGSKDCTIIFWKNKKQWISHKLESSIILIKNCESSKQFAISQVNGKITIFNSFQIANRNLKSERIIEGSFDTKFLIELDDSFVLVFELLKVYLGQINLGKIYGQRDINWGNVVAVKGIGRLILISLVSRGLCLLKI